jgi:hypothetical protein
MHHMGQDLASPATELVRKRFGGLPHLRGQVGGGSLGDGQLGSQVSLLGLQLREVLQRLLLQEA